MFTQPTDDITLGSCIHFNPLPDVIKNRGYDNIERRSDAADRDVDDADEDPPLLWREWLVRRESCGEYEGSETALFGGQRRFWRLEREFQSGEGGEVGDDKV
jgi:hypothetical protein